MRSRGREDKVEAVKQRGEVWPSNSVNLKDAERQKYEPAVELAKVHVSQQAQDIYRPSRDAIVR